MLGGLAVISSPYHRDKILYSTSPADIRLNSSLEEITVSNVFLILKAIKMPVYNVEDKFYYFDGKDIGGFIFQSPDQKRLAIHLYDINNLNYTILFRGGGATSWDDIQFFLASLKVNNKTQHLELK